jgi:hypothetical protein
MIRTEHEGLGVCFMEFIGFGVILEYEMSVDRVHRSGGPQLGGGSRVHGGPRSVAAERLTRARARGRSGEWKLAGGGGKGKGILRGSYRG